MLNLNCRPYWKHHRSGWAFCLQTLQELHRNDGIIFVGCIEGLARPITKPWTGFFHYPPKNGAAKFLKEEIWKQSAQSCIGLFCLSKHLGDFLKEQTQVPVENVYYATPTPRYKFSWNQFNSAKKLVLIGGFLRNTKGINKLNSPYPKFLLEGSDVDYSEIKTNESVGRIPRLSNDDYDQLLASSLVFLPLFDVSANTTIVECIVRNTPVLTNRLPASEEYLGKDYPLFYQTLEEASDKLEPSLVYETHKYLSRMDKSHLQPDYFLKSVRGSKILRRMFL
jgi:hypothetical protein